MEAVGKRVRKGWRENQVAAELSRELLGRGLEATVILVGSDERLKRYRHPLPTNHKIQKTVMMVICAKGYGLIANLTRVVYFGPMPTDLRLRHQACLEVECAMWGKSRVGTEAQEVFEAGVSEYSARGFPGEWKKHHQGGPTGYETRDYLATPDCSRRLVENQALAWNPSITGTKSEDTVLLTTKGLELLTPTPLWPMIKMNYAGKKYLRPDILSKTAN
jgi:Xaa-Pro aminopeptidase